MMNTWGALGTLKCDMHTPFIIRPLHGPLPGREIKLLEVYIYVYYIILMQIIQYVHPCATIRTMFNSVLDTLKDAQKIVIIQAENPDGDSLGSSLALEELLCE